ncbi:MAG: hypothetical protein D6702_12780 [Planctomycetota bacterium]|nr:MAG: hypothetical protein D6702_12780 [Planctomycetota bacterium]
MNRTSPITRTQQILVGSLMVGCFLCGAVIARLVFSDWQPERTLSAGPFALALILLAALAAVVPNLGRQAFLDRLHEQLRAGDDQGAGQAILQRTVLRAVLVESFGLVGGIFALVSGVAWFDLAPFLAVAWLGLGFPTERRTQELLRGQG